MVGVNEFKNEDHAAECVRLAKIRLAKIKKVFSLSIILAIAFPICFVNSSNALFDFLGLLMLAANIFISIYTGAYKYWWKFTTIPLRHGFFLLGSLFASVCLFGIAWECLLFFPVFMLCYEKHLCNITIESVQNSLT